MADLLLKGAAEDAETLVRRAEANRSGWLRVHATDLRLLRDALRAALDAADARPADNDSPVPTGQPKGGDVDCAPHAVTSCKVNTNASERVGSNAGPGTDNPARPTPSASCDLCGATDPADRRMAGNVNDRYPCPRPFHSPTPPAPDAAAVMREAYEYVSDLAAKADDEIGKYPKTGKEADCGE